MVFHPGYFYKHSLFLPKKGSGLAGTFLIYCDDIPQGLKTPPLGGVSFQLANNGNAGNMRLCALVPVQEAFHIDHIANIQSLNSLVNIGICAGANHISIDGEGTADRPEQH